MSARDVAFHGTLVRLAVRDLDTAHGRFTAHLCRNLHSREPMIALAFGDLSGPDALLARVHSSCVTSESFGGCDCDCSAQLDAALAAVARAGRGLVLHLSQEGRGAGFSAKARDRMLVQASRQRLTTFEAYAAMGLARDHRRYEEVASVLRLLGVEAPLLVLTNNPDKKRALDDADVKIAGTAPLGCGASAWSRHYLAAKFEQGHALADPSHGAPAAELPEPVAAVAPSRLPDAPGFVHVASYLLPVATSDTPVWLRLHAHLDVASGEERVVFTHGGNGGEDALVRIQRTSLLERFARWPEGAERARWRASAAALADAPAGVALVLPSPPPWAEAERGAANTEPLPDALGPLLAHHLHGRRARLLLADDERAGEERLRARLARHGIASAESVSLHGA